MSNSLKVGGLEVMGLTSPGNPNPEYRLGTGLDFGALNPATVTLSSLLLDGNFISGDQTPNKVWTITVLVSSPSVQTRLDLSTRMDTLLRAVYAETFSVVWTPSSGVANNYTAFKAACSPVKSVMQNDNLIESVTIVFSTGPFAASTALQTIAVPATGAVAQLQIDGMNSGSFTGPGSPALSTTTKYEGAGSMKVVSGGVISGAGRTITSVNLSIYPSASARVTCSTLTAGSVTLQLLLTSAAGTATYASPTMSLPFGSSAWVLLLFDLTAPSHTTGTFNIAAVTAWSFSGVVSGTGGSANVFFDDLRAYPPGSVGNADAQGGVLIIPVGGSARTPVALEIDRNGSTFTNALVHSPPIDQDPDVTIHAGLSAGTITIPAANMNYDDSFAVKGIVTANGTGTRTVTVLVTQKIGATTIATKTWTVTVTGTTNTIVDLTPPDGPLALPLVAQPPENTNGSLVFLITSSGGTADTFSDIDLLSTSGQTYIVTGLGALIACEALYIDQPTPGVDAGNIYQAGSIARTSAYSAQALAFIPGGPILFEPGNNKLLVVSASGALGATALLYDLWLDEALS